MGPLHSTDAAPSPAPKPVLIGAAGRNAATFAAALAGQTQQGILKDVQKRHRVLAHLHTKPPSGRAVGFAPARLLNLKKLTGVKRAAASVYNQYGAYIARKAREIGVSPTLVAATIMNETGGRASANQDGESGDQKPVIRFEVHQFRKWALDGLKKRRPKKSGKSERAAWEKECAEKSAAFDALFVYDHSHSSHGHKFRKSPSEEWQWVHIQDKEARQARGKGADYAEAQKQEYAALEFAKTLDEQAAMQSFSMGLTQIMGFNAAAAGYASAQAMFADFSTGQEAQLDGFFTFLANYKSGKCLKALQDKDYVAYFHLYNGGKPGSADNTAYAKAMEAHADAYEAVTQGLPAPDAAPTDAPTDALPHAADPHASSDPKPLPSLEMALAQRRASAPLETASAPLLGPSEDFQTWLHGSDHAPLMTPLHPAAVAPSASPFALGPSVMPWIDEFLLSHTAPTVAVLPPGAALPPRLAALMAQDRLPAADIAEARTLIAQVPDAAQRGRLYEQIQAKSLYHNQRFSKSDATEADIGRHDYLKKKGSTIGDYMCNLTSLSMVLESLGIANPDAAHYAEYQDYLEHVRREEGSAERTDEAGWGNVAGKLGAHYRKIADVGKQDAPWWKTNILPEIQRGHGIMMSITGHIVRVQDVTDPGLIVDDPFGKVTLGDGSDTKAKHDWSYDKTVTYEPLPPSATPAKLGKGGKAAKAPKPKFKKIVHSNANATTANTGAGVQGEDSVWPWPAVKNHSMQWIASFFRAEEENAPGGVVTTPLFQTGLTAAGGLVPGVKKTKVAKAKTDKKASPVIPAAGKAIPSALGASSDPATPILSTVSSSPLTVQRSGHGSHPDADPGALLHGLKKQSSGFQPGSDLRGKLGGHLGFDPGGARLHTGPAAAQAARNLNAEAFTIGSDVFFGEGRYDPSSSKGLGLIAHELTHVGQQTGTTGDKARFYTGRGGDEMEQEAQQVGERVLANAGRSQGVSVGLYDRRYESDGEEELAPSDQQRLDMISLMALTEAENLLWQRGIRGRKTLNALDIDISLDLSRMSNQEAAQVWADAIVTRVGASEADAAPHSQAAPAPTTMPNRPANTMTTMIQRESVLHEPIRPRPPALLADINTRWPNGVLVIVYADFQSTTPPPLTPEQAADPAAVTAHDAAVQHAAAVDANNREFPRRAREDAASLSAVGLEGGQIVLGKANPVMTVGDVSSLLRRITEALAALYVVDGAALTPFVDSCKVKQLLIYTHGESSMIELSATSHERTAGQQSIGWMGSAAGTSLHDFATSITPYLTHNVNIALFTCNAAGPEHADSTDPRHRRQIAHHNIPDADLVGENGENSFADRLRDELSRGGLTDATTGAHTDAAHTTGNPNLRLFGGDAGGRDLAGGGRTFFDYTYSPEFITTEAAARNLTEPVFRRQLTRWHFAYMRFWVDPNRDHHHRGVQALNLPFLAAIDPAQARDTMLDAYHHGGPGTAPDAYPPRRYDATTLARSAMAGAAPDAGPQEEEAQNVGEAVAQGLPTTGVMGRWYGLAQPSSTAGGLLVQRSPIQMASGGYVGTGAGVGNNRREEVLQAMDALHTLWDMSNAEYVAEYPTVAALPPGSDVTTPLPNTDTALTRNAAPTLAGPVAQHYLGGAITGSVGRGQANARQDIVLLMESLRVDGYLSDADYARELGAVMGWAAGSLFSTGAGGVPDALLPRTYAALTRMKAAIVAGTFAGNVMAGTHTVTPTEHAQIEQILTPGATLAPPPPPVSSTPPTATPPPPVIVPPAAMTGRGVGGPFERDMLAALRTNVHWWASEFRKLKGQTGQPSMPITGANDIAVAAQTEVERYFSPYISVASRAPSDKYHPGSFSLTSKLGDQSTRPITPGARLGWTGYWMTLDGVGQNVLNRYHCIPTRSPDDAEFTRVQQLYALSPANQADIDDAIHSWPAEAGTGTVFIQPYQSQTGGVPQQRRNRWDLFTTLVHEMMHVLEHPNFGRTANTIGGSAQKYLTEGFADLMRHELWDGPGRLVSRLASTQMDPLRRQVEGTTYPYDPRVVQYHPDYTELTQARQIDSIIGHQNAKAAFFLGHTELLGLGEGTATQGGTPLTGIGQYHATDSADAETIVVGPGDTVSSLQTRTNAPFGGILGPTGTPLVPMMPLTPGTRVRVPGIRWIYAIQNDTLGSVARQQAVRMTDLMRANQLPSGTPESHAFPVGTRILIPIP